MGKKFDLDAATKLCNSLEKVVQTIANESAIIRHFFAILNDSFSDLGYYEFKTELQEADSTIDSICVDINDLIVSLKNYTVAMGELLSQSERLLYSEPKTTKVAKNTNALNSIQNWLPDINPNYDRFDISSPYSNNCGSCAFAIFQRLEGLNPTACATAENIGYNYQMEQLTGLKQVKTSPNEIEACLLNAGHGAHAIIGVDRSFGPGHWFNAICLNGKVYAIDGQSGDIIEWPPDYGNVVNWEMSVSEV